MKQDQYNILSGNNVFSYDDEIKRFFEKEGFEIEKYSHLKIFGELTSVKNLGLSQEEIVKIKQILNIKDTFNAISLCCQLLLSRHTLLVFEDSHLSIQRSQRREK